MAWYTLTCPKHFWNIIWSVFNIRFVDTSKQFHDIIYISTWVLLHPSSPSSKPTIAVFDKPLQITINTNISHSILFFLTRNQTSMHFLSQRKKSCSLNLSIYWAFSTANLFVWILNFAISQLVISIIFFSS